MPDQSPGTVTTKGKNTMSDFTTPTGQPSRVRHGDYSAYTLYGCRCDKCKRTNTNYQAGLRRASGVKPNTGPKHGTTNMYQNYGCRCGACKAANAASQRRYRAARAFNIAKAAMA